MHHVHDFFLFRIGHDNAGFRADWLLERVEIEVPKLGRTWVFPCGKWISKSRGEHQLEVELYPKDMATDVFNPRTLFSFLLFDRFENFSI